MQSGTWDVSCAWEHFCRDQKVLFKGRPKAIPNCGGSPEWERYLAGSWAANLQSFMRSVTSSLQVPLLRAAYHTTPRQACWAAKAEYQVWYRSHLQRMNLQGSAAARQLNISVLPWAESCSSCCHGLSSCDAHYAPAAYQALWHLVADELRAWL